MSEPENMMANPDARPGVRLLDDHGRTVPEDMTDRELAEETVRTLRAVGDALAPLMNPEIARLGPLGIMKALMNGGK